MIIREDSQRFINKKRSIKYEDPLQNRDLYKDGKIISFASGNVFESLAKTNPELFNTAKIKQLKASENLVKDFTDYLTWLYNNQAESINDFQNKHPGNQTTQDELNLCMETFNVVVVGGMAKDEQVLIDKGLSEDEIKKTLFSEYIPEGLDEEAIQKILDLRIKNNKILTDSLTKMIKMNYKIFELTEAEASSLIEELEDDETNNEGIAKIKEAFKNPKILDKFRIGKNNFDFRSIGGACVFLSDDDSIKFTQHPSKNLSRIFKYDAIIVGHGSEVEGSSVSKAIEIADKNFVTKSLSEAIGYTTNIINNANNIADYINQTDPSKQDAIDILIGIKDWLKSINTLIRKAYLDQKDIDKLLYLSNNAYQSITDLIMNFTDQLKFMESLNDAKKAQMHIKKIDSYIKAKNNPKQAMKDGGSRDWTVQPIDTLQASGLDTIVDILRQLKKEGFKKIFVGACNPGGIRLPKDLANDKDFSVYYGTANVYLESIYEFPEYQSILEMECILDSALDRYGRHYEDMSVGELYMEYAKLTESVITEGNIGDKLKTIAKRAWEIITTIWRKVVEFIKKVLATIIEKLSKKFSKAGKMKKPIKTSYIEIKNDKPVVTEVTISNTQELNKIVRDRIINLQNWAKKTLSEQDRINSKLQNELNKRKLSSTDSSVKESSFFDDIIFI